MLTTACINPEIMKALSLCGHGDKVLIADGNYPLAARSGDACKVYLGLTSGVPEVTQVLEVLGKVINIEKAEVMTPGDGSIPPVFNEFSTILGGMVLDELGRYEFYDECDKPSVKLAISTGEKRVFANVLITVGVA